MLGVFINDLAERVDKLYLLAHTTSYKSHIHDCPINNKISVVSLGRKKNAIHRLFLGCSSLRKSIRKCDPDVLLVRAPSPLAPWLYKSFRKHIPVFFLLVGDYSTLKVPLFTSSFLLYQSYERIMNDFVLPKCTCLVNSNSLYRKYKNIAKDIFEVRTTTITKKDFFHREDTCQSEKVNLLYVGRFDWNKGLKELLESVKSLHNLKANVFLHLVGWDETPSQHILKEIKLLISELDIQKEVIIEGKKRIGIELNEMYRNSDIFILPSYSEGMPRCIWEAMANGLPVISTNVGGIPYNITNEEAILVNPYSSKELTDSILMLINSPTKRKSLIKNGYIKASEATLDVCNSHIIDCIISSYNNENN